MAASIAHFRGQPHAVGLGNHERYQKVYEQRTAFMNEERTGYVWLFLRK